MKVLLRRHGDGIGDWLFMLAAMKHINEQHPDVTLYVDFNLNSIGSRKRELSRVVSDAYRASDVVWHLYTGGDVDVDVEHVVYDRHKQGEPYIAGMVKQLAMLIDRPIVYAPSCIPVFVFADPVLERPRAAYFTIVSQGKSETAHKDWGINNFERVAGYLERELYVAVVQLGADSEYRLQGAHVRHELGVPFDRLAGLLNDSLAFIGIENGLAVLASMLGVPTLVIYRREQEIGRMPFAPVIPCLNPTPAEVAEYCKGFLNAHRTMPMRPVVA